MIEHLEIIAIVGSVIGFFLSLRYAITRIDEAVNELATKIEAGNERLAKQIEKMGSHAAQEHAALMRAVEKMSERDVARQEKLLDAMNRDHRDMGEKVGNIETLTSKMDAKLDAHMSEERRK